MWILLGTAGVVLLIACANVANLLLVRGESRHQELAVRVALGADWLRIARQLLLESVSLAVAGGLLGLPLAFVGIRVLTTIRPSHIPRLDAITIDATVLLYALAVSLLTGLLFGLVPVPQIRRAPPRACPARWRTRLKNAAAPAPPLSQRAGRVQVALALVLLISSGLMLRSFQALRDVRPGFPESGATADDAHFHSPCGDSRNPPMSSLPSNSSSNASAPSPAYSPSPLPPPSPWMATQATTPSLSRNSGRRRQTAADAPL